MKKNFEQVKAYIKSVSDEELHDMQNRLGQRFQDDLTTCLKFFEKSLEVDKWLGAAGSSDEFFSMVDQIHRAVNMEVDRRNEVRV